MECAHHQELHIQRGSERGESEMKVIRKKNENVAKFCIATGSGIIESHDFQWYIHVQAQDRTFAGTLNYRKLYYSLKVAEFFHKYSYIKFISFNSFHSKMEFPT